MPAALWVRPRWRSAGRSTWSAADSGHPDHCPARSTATTSGCLIREGCPLHRPAPDRQGDLPMLGRRRRGRDGRHPLRRRGRQALGLSQHPAAYDLQIDSYAQKDMPTSVPRPWPAPSTGSFTSWARQRQHEVLSAATEAIQIPRRTLGRRKAPMRTGRATWLPARWTGSCT